MNVSSVALSIKMAATATGESPLSNLAANLTLSPFALKDIVTASFLTTAILFAAAPDIIPYEPELSKYFSGVNVAYLKPWNRFLSRLSSGLDFYSTIPERLSL